MPDSVMRTPTTPGDPTFLGRPQPHKGSPFFRLMSLFDRTQRPVLAGDDTLSDPLELAAQDRVQAMLSLGTERVRRYEVFDEMDEFGLVQSIGDVYAEESTQRDYDRGVSVWIESTDKRIKQAAEDCLHNLQVEDRIAPTARNVVKFGDCWRRLLYASGKGVMGWQYARPHEMARVEDRYSRLVGFKQNKETFRHRSRETSWPWDYVHFRMLGKREEEGYGVGIYENFFREWRTLVLSEDSMLMYRLRKAPDRSAIFVPVGNLEDADAMEVVNRWRKKFRKHEFIDPANAEYKKQYNPLTPLEDIFLPVRPNQEPRIETISGGGNIDEIYDIDHFRDRFFGAAKVPKAYFGFEGDVNAKATLQQQDIRFARGCKRVQRAVLYGIRTAVDVHLTLLNEGDNKGNYDFQAKGKEYIVQMAPISYLDEFERLELLRMRYELVQQMAAMAEQLQMDARIWSTYVLLTFAKLPEDLVLKLVSKVPRGDEKGSGEGFEALGADKQRQILDREGDAAKGFYSLTERERTTIAKMVGMSPKLQRSISNMVEATGDYTLENWRDQCDPSLRSPKFPTAVKDAVPEDAAAKQLHEDLQEAQASGGVT